MIIKVIGCGNAFSNKNFNQCVMLEECGESNIQRMLVDCGYQTGAALHAAGIPLKSINDIYVSHLHADHVGFLEGIGFQRYDWVNKPPSSKHQSQHIGPGAVPVPIDHSHYAPNLYGNEGLLRDLWKHTLSGGMRCIEGIDATIDTFFYTRPIAPGDYFEWMGWKCELIQQIHIMAGSYISNTFGLFMTHISTGYSIYFTTDSQHCSPHQVEVFYKKADLIIQDCECIGVDTKTKTSKFMSGVHANFAQLAGWESANSTKLTPDIKAKMFLSHYQDFVTDGKDMYGNDCDWEALAKEEGFRGFLKVGQVIDQGELWLKKSLEECKEHKE